MKIEKMEQDKLFKFKLFVPPKLNNAQVSAVKPQTHTRDEEFYQNFNKNTKDDYNLPFGMNSASKHIDATGPVSQKIKLVPEIDQENMETVNELYSRLYKEAEKIKRWKITVEYELKEKERKFQENRKIIEALHKAIQELQFENEKLSLKLEDEIHENKDLLKENNTTRHLCDLLKEKFMQSVEKSNKYEQEREETRQMYVDLNNNIERMIQAFEELRVQAENSRLEMYFKLKEEAEKMAQLDKEHRREMNAMEKQVSLLTMQNGEKDDKMKHLSIHLQESRELIAELEEVRKQQDEILKESQSKKQSLLTELEEAKSSLQKTEDTLRSLETELQAAVKTLIQATEQKEVTIEELKQTKILHASDINELQSKVFNLKELLEKEQKRQKELNDASDTLFLELQKKSNELELVVKLKNDREKQVEEMARALESSNEVQKDLKHQLECAQSECILLMKEKESRNSNDSIMKVQLQELLDGKQVLEKTFEKLQKREKEQRDIVQIREKEIHDLEMQLSGAYENNENCLQQLRTVKAELEKETLKNKQLNMDWDNLLMDKENITTENNNLLNELRKLQEALKDQKKMRENAEKQTENLKKTNNHLSSELECLKEEMKKNNEEAKNKLDETGENVRNIENELSKKEKQLKASESKINSLKKQFENKVKTVEELQQENKILRKKVTTESKQSSINEGKVIKLQLELENTNKLHKEAIDSYKNETEIAKAAEAELHKKLEAMKLVADEAVKIQKETDIRCQHKITEMVALMEKHKRQYDKTVEEKDTELEYYKTKEQELTSAIELLERELSCKKNELSSLQEQLKIEIEEKEHLAKERNKDDISKKEKMHKNTQTHILETPKTNLKSPPLHSKNNASQNYIATNVNKMEYTEKASWTPAKIYTVRTPPKSKLQRESTNLHSEEGKKKKRKVILEMDTRSDSSENNDLLSLVSKEEKFKQLYKDPPVPHVMTPNVMTPKKNQTPSTLKTPGSSVNLASVRKMQEAGWSAISKMDRRNKMKEAGKLFS
ncbi:synaptonemal complex protein 1 isoform X2 [Sceloporus undulatus]|uniref:synaptonemal complex protein 1 isoform X2 n=1 Tax=Sceloporus undulatus TaxID=8520 RepID=UPI001C4D8AB7|nr:synaptonemal complex protein 1 isoform X2 [Sceloporus undulatus]